MVINLRNVASKIASFIPVVKQAHAQTVQTVQTAVKRQFNPPAKVGGKTIYYGVTPFSGVGSSATRIGGFFARNARRLYGAVTHNPLEGASSVATGLRAFGSKILGRAIGFTTAIESFQLAKSSITGQPFNPIPNIKEISALALNPASAVIGFVGGGFSKYGATPIINLAEKYRTPEFDYKKFQELITPPAFSGSPTLNISSVAPPASNITVGAPGFSPSISTGSGIPNELLLLLLAGLGGAGAGYFFGRKKKKKYKKRKRH